MAIPSLIHKIWLLTYLRKLESDFHKNLTEFHQIP